MRFFFTSLFPKYTAPLLALLACGAPSAFASDGKTPPPYDFSPWPADQRDEVARIVAWPFNDRDRPPPPRAMNPVALAPAAPPRGAIVLFDGGALSEWRESRWEATDDHIEIKPGSGDLVSRRAFGSCRLHLQWWTPPGPGLKQGQNRGNSGVFFMGLYEVQVLDSYQNSTYADGMAGAVYGQHPPLTDALLPPGAWQTYLIEFKRPVFDRDGKLVRPARLTVDLNGVRVQENALLIGPTNPPGRRFYSAHPGALPLRIQDHKERVRFRAIWIEPLPD